MNVVEWKERNIKTVTLTSGLEVKVRRLPGFAFGEIGPLPKLEDAASEDQMKFARAVLVKALIFPVIGEGPEDVSIYDFTMEDINEIMEAVMSISGRADDSPLAEGGTSAGATPS